MCTETWNSTAFTYAYILYIHIERGACYKYIYIFVIARRFTTRTDIKVMSIERLNKSIYTYITGVYVFLLCVAI